MNLGPETSAAAAALLAGIGGSATGSHHGIRNPQQPQFLHGGSGIPPPGRVSLVQLQGKDGVKSVEELEADIRKANGGGMVGGNQPQQQHHHHQVRHLPGQQQQQQPPSSSAGSGDGDMSAFKKFVSTIGEFFVK